MKKFLLTLWSIFAVMILPAISEAADMPDFQQLSGGITFDEESSDSSTEGVDDFNSGSRFYFFTCPFGQESNCRWCEGTKA